MSDSRINLLHQELHTVTPVPLQIAEEGTDAPFTWEMTTPFALIGRSGQCDLKLPHPNVSFRHAYLQNFGGRIFCIDLNSRNGIVYNGERRRGAWLSDEESLLLGSYELCLANHQAETQTIWPYPHDFNPLEATEICLPSLGAVNIEFFSRSSVGQTWKINRVLTLIGSGAGCKIRLEDEQISRVHCGLLITDAGLWAIDFLGQGGIQVDGESVPFALLETGQELKVGQFGMRVKYEGNREIPPPEKIELSGSTTVLEDLEPAAEEATKIACEPEAVPAIKKTMTSQEFLDAILTSGLLDDEQATDLPAQVSFDVPSEDEDGAAAIALSEKLIDEEILSVWQVAQLLAGRGEHLLVAGRYRLQERIGRGSMGSIYLAYDPQRNDHVAIKIPKARVFKKPRMLERFRREAMINDKLQHPNIVRAYNIDVSGNFIVMEYVNGQNLKQFLAESGAQTPEFSVNLAIQVGEALQFAYRNGVVHRDVKPSNILLTAEGDAKLLDLGLARVDGEANSETDWDMQQVGQMTQAGVQLGTVRYMSPEQAVDGRSADTRSDIYSLGCTLYQLLAGVPPFDSPSPIKILMSHAKEPVPPISGVDPLLMEVVAQAMEKDPDNRFQTPGEMVARLRDWQAIHRQQQQLDLQQAQLDEFRMQAAVDLSERIKRLNIAEPLQTEILKTIEAVLSSNPDGHESD